MEKLEEGDEKNEKMMMMLIDTTWRRFRNFLVHNYNEHRVLSEQDKAKIVTRMEKSINNMKNIQKIK